VTIPPLRRRRHSRAVYRRRRLAVLFVLVVVIAAVVFVVIAQPWRGAPQSSSSLSPVDSPAATGAASPSAPPGAATPGAAASTPTPGGTPGACTANEVTVDPVVDQTSYASGQNPKLSIKLTNTSGVDCTINVGSAQQVFTITSGSDTWWRSTDCQTDPSDQVVTLTAGQSVQSASPLTWDRTRSSVDTCNSTSRPRAGAGGATYHLSVSIGGIPSTQTASFQLN
jgi:hypothetical protein